MKGEVLSLVGLIERWCLENPMEDIFASQGYVGVIFDLDLAYWKMKQQQKI